MLCEVLNSTTGRTGNKKEKTSNNFLKSPLHIRKTVLLLEEEEELQSVVFEHKDRDLKSNNKEK